MEGDANPTLQVSGKAEISSVSMLDTSLMYYTVHISVQDYPRVAVIGCELGRSTNQGVLPWGLLATAPSPISFYVPPGSPKKLEAFLQPIG